MRVIRVAIIVACVSLAGCGSDQSTVWSAKAASPNGHLIAYASTKQISGPGNNWVSTGVYLEQAKVAHPVQVLSFSNDSAYPVGATAVTLRWPSNSQLDVTYKSGATIEFQAIKALGVAIQTHKQAAP